MEDYSDRNTTRDIHNDLTLVTCCLRKTDKAKLAVLLPLEQVKPSSRYSLYYLASLTSSIWPVEFSILPPSMEVSELVCTSSGLNLCFVTARTPGD